MKRACLGPAPWVRCPRRALIDTGSRCSSCRSAYQRRRDARRGTPAQRGYNAEYQRNRKAVLAASDGMCAWGCGRAATTVDHVVPLARGGSNDLDNLVPACATCNSSRGSNPDWRPPRW